MSIKDHNKNFQSWKEFINETAIYTYDPETGEKLGPESGEMLDGSFEVGQGRALTGIDMEDQDQEIVDTIVNAALGALIGWLVAAGILRLLQGKTLRSKMNKAFSKYRKQGMSRKEAYRKMMDDLKRQHPEIEKEIKRAEKELKNQKQNQKTKPGQQRRRRKYSQKQWRRAQARIRAGVNKRLRTSPIGRLSRGRLGKLTNFLVVKPLKVGLATIGAATAILMDPVDKIEDAVGTLAEFLTGNNPDLESTKDIGSIDYLKTTHSSGQKGYNRKGTHSMSKEPLQGNITNLPILGIQHNLTGEKKRIGDMYLRTMRKLGITNKYVLAGALATSGKESGFVGKAEKAGYSFNRLRNKNYAGNKAVANRVRAVFRHQIGREPNDQEWRQLSRDNGKKGGIALFNIAYGYESLGRGIYTTYQEEEAISHEKIPVITSPGVINPALYIERSGYKYRGRGSIQITFRENYRRTAILAGLVPKKILDNPDLLITNPEIGVIMNAARSKGSYKKASRNLNKHGLSGNPDNLLDGIKFMCYLAGGGGGNPNNSWFQRAVAAAVKQANKHIRIIEDEATS